MLWVPDSGASSGLGDATPPPPLAPLAPVGRRAAAAVRPLSSAAVLTLSPLPFSPSSSNSTSARSRSRSASTCCAFLMGGLERRGGGLARRERGQTEPPPPPPARSLSPLPSRVAHPAAPLPHPPPPPTTVPRAAASPAPARAAPGSTATSAWASRRPRRCVLLFFFLSVDRGRRAGPLSQTGAAARLTGRWLRHGWWQGTRGVACCPRVGPPSRLAGGGAGPPSRAWTAAL